MVALKAPDRAARVKASAPGRRPGRGRARGRRGCSPPSAWLSDDDAGDAAAAAATRAVAGAHADAGAGLERAAGAPTWPTFYAQAARRGSSCRGDFECATLTVPGRLPGPRRRDHRARAAQGPRRRARPTGSARWSSTRAARARPARRTPRTPRSPSATCSATTSTSSASTRAAPATPTPSTASPTRELDAFVAGRPRPGHPARRGRRSSRATRRSGQGCVSQLRRAWSATSPRSRRPATWTCCGPRSASRQLIYFGASYGTKLGATYADLFPDKVGRLVLDGAVDLSIDSRQLEPRAGRGLRGRAAVLRRRTASTSGDCFLGDTLDEGLGTIQDLIADVDAAAAPDQLGDRELDRRQRLLRAGGAALQPRLLVDPRPGAGAGARRRRHAAAAALRPLRVAQRRRHLLRQQRRGDPARSTASTTPTRSPPTRCPPRSRDFEEASPTFGDVFAWGLMGCHGVQAESSEPTPDVRRGRRGADRGHRHDPRPGDAVPVGGAPRRPARVRRAGQPRRRRAHRLQLRQRLRRRGGRGLPRRRHVPEDGLEC